MSDLGRQLRDARLARGLSLDDVQEMTKIRKRYLEAIEAGDFKVLPGSFYVRAFIKTYAEAVGLNADELLQEHQDAVPEAEPEPVMEPVVQQRRSARRTASTGRSGKWLSTVLMWTFPILIIVLVWIFVINNKNGAPDIADNTTPPKQQQSTTTTPPSTTTPPTQNTGQQQPSDSTGTEQQPSGTGTEQTPGGTESTDGTETGTETAEGTTTDTSANPVITEAGKEGRNTIFNVNYTGTTPLKVNIAATGQSWLEVYKSADTSGERLFYNNTESGQSLSYDLTDTGLFIKSGNSRATNITINGQTITDGKATSRIVLKWVKEDAAAAGTSTEGTDSTGTTGTTEGTDSTGTTSTTDTGTTDSSTDGN
ncbi:helix-turn-helix domain-containing protein [Paenibacillus wulumuqiensis]|uniref:helix-turn-helix domain-containing protein n=1 Tax=Paenibacillus wulumuqiensis TaxID=1567107 RepID=UPI0006191A7C|nr:helix-turn-helix domain-containing protein [Paenibacillus wulumuqiensis]